MSFLDQLTRSKSKLKRAATLVTRPDGTQTIEEGTSIRRLTSTTPGFVIDTAPDNTPACVVDHLYLGSQDCADPTVLAKFNIQYVLSIGISPYGEGQHPEQIICKFVDFLDLPDSNLFKILDSCLQFINLAISKGASILVHCNAGVSRSASIVIAYLIRYCFMQYNEAYAHVKRVRPSIRPNDGFVKQLQQFGGL